MLLEYCNRLFPNTGRCMHAALFKPYMLDCVTSLSRPSCLSRPQRLKLV